MKLAIHFGIIDSTTTTNGSSTTSTTSTSSTSDSSSSTIFDKSNKQHESSSNDLMSLFMAQITALSQMGHKTPRSNNALDVINLNSKDVFETALKVTLKFEGGYANTKGDKGGETNYGITHATYDAWRTSHHQQLQNVRNITPEEVKQIYYEKYWVASGADKVSDPKMAIALFDTAVLHGVSAAKKMFGESGGNLEAFLQVRQESYQKIVARNPEQNKFSKSWNSRVATLGSLLSPTIA